MNRTKSEQARFDNMKDLGCIACILDGRIEPFGFGYAPEIHHMLSGNKRIGHMATVPLCQWHHTGVGNCVTWSNAEFHGLIGPSWHKHRREFRNRYGSDAELIETVNQYLGEK